jgi:recombinational DNA repair ATPase RecF
LSEYHHLKLHRLEIKNFRCFDNFDLVVNGESLFFINENGGGKTSLFSALRTR